MKSRFASPEDLEGGLCPCKQEEKKRIARPIRKSLLDATFNDFFLDSISTIWKCGGTYRNYLEVGQFK